MLTENGFISNLDDFAGIISESTNNKKAEKIALGVLDYFNSFYKNVANDDDNSYNDDNYGPNGQPPVQEPEPPIEEPPTQPPVQDPEEDLEQEENDKTGDENEKQ